MTLSRQEDPRTTGRTNQKARTRAALVDAADGLLREGRWAPSMAEAAERALVSVATAYRYFSSAEELWEEASIFRSDQVYDEATLIAALEAAGDDLEARVEVVIRQVGWAFIDHQSMARQIMKASMDRWFASRDADAPGDPVRPGRRNHVNALALQPLRGTLPDEQVDGLVEALGVVLGTETVLTLIDVLQLTPEAAKTCQLRTALWILRAGLAEAAAT